MKLKDIAAISGKSGLYKILQPTRTGVIVESMDEKKSRFMAGGTTKISILKDVSIYSTDKEGSVVLREVLETIFKKHSQSLPVTSKSSPEELAKFIESIVPKYDKEKVYASDIKKLVNWYELLLPHMPAVLEKDEEEIKQEEEAKTTKSSKKEEAAEKPKKAKGEETKKAKKGDDKEAVARKRNTKKAEKINDTSVKARGTSQKIAAKKP